MWKRGILGGKSPSSEKEGFSPGILFSYFQGSRSGPERVKRLSKVTCQWQAKDLNLKVYLPEKSRFFLKTAVI